MTTTDWIEVQSFKCSRCSKIYHELHPDKCICRSPYEVGNIIGPFKIIGAKVDEKIPVICVLCDCSKDLHYTAIKRQKSCGCKPKHIEVIESTEDFIRYKCNKCGKTVSDELPILHYCCE
jgi:hypothetical protein